MKPWIFFVLFAAAPAPAHEGHPQASGPKSRGAQVGPAVERISEAYKTQVKPIFDRKCNDCHSSATVFPWYHSIPGVRQFIDSDIAEAKEHLDISGGFPFKGHGKSAKDDLEAVQHEVDGGDMPPWYYRMMHKGSALTPDEVKAVDAWVGESLKALKPSP